ncbi:unnamed protein product [Closterium sp. Yama58-4]|nr:unnamed protein product [Closterium sp. Yama58-4]
MANGEAPSSNGYMQAAAAPPAPRPKLPASTPSASAKAQLSSAKPQPVPAKAQPASAKTQPASAKAQPASAKPQPASSKAQASPAAISAAVAAAAAACASASAAAASPEAASAPPAAPSAAAFPEAPRESPSVAAVSEAPQRSPSAAEAAAATATPTRAATPSPPPPPPLALPAPPSSPPPLHVQLQLLHFPYLSEAWTAEEQRLLDQGLARFPADQFPPAQRYLKIAATLPEKTARDVALRCKWLQRKEAGKRRRAEEITAAKKPNAKTASGPLSPLSPSLRPPLYRLLSCPSTGEGAGARGAGGGASGAGVSGAGAGGGGGDGCGPADTHTDGADNSGSLLSGDLSPDKLLEQNVELIAQVKATLAANKSQECNGLLIRLRDNILSVVHG